MTNQNTATAQVNGVVTSGAKPNIKDIYISIELPFIKQHQSPV